MADIFRILSRSTNLSKKGHQKPPTVAATPPPVAVSQSNPRNSKGRKPISTSRPIPDLAPELDFFGQGDEKKLKSKKRKREEENRDEASDSDTGESEGGDEDNVDGDEDGGLVLSNGTRQGATDRTKVFTEEEIRQLMKEHKLKLTLLNPPPPPTSDDTKSKKRRKTKEKEQKAAAKEAPKKLQPTQPTTLLTSFDQLQSTPYNLSKRLFSNLTTQGYKTPTSVQMASLPLLLLSTNSTPSGALTQSTPSKNEESTYINLVTCAPTGSGKTLAYLLPLLSWVLSQRSSLQKTGENPAGVKAIILAPTKELVGQIHNEGLKLTIGTGIKVSILNKSILPRTSNEDERSDDDDSNSASSSSNEGEPLTNPTSANVKSDILVSTPSMLLHALQTSHIDLSKTSRLILDEADVLLEKREAGGGFGIATLQAWSHLLQNKNRNHPSSSSSPIRAWLWSATIPSSVEELFSKTSSSHSTSLTSSHTASPPLLRLIIGLKNTSLPTITHKLLYTATEPGKLLALRSLLTTSLPPPAIIFTQTIPRATALYSEILYDLPFYAPGRIACLHSNLSDNTRAEIMDRFRRGDIWILVTTDLLSRGVDFRGVNVVINYDIPTSAASYIHRAGRTGRAGREGGVVYTYYTKEDVGYVKPIAGIIAQSERVGKGGNGEGSTDWLLSYLPKVSKVDKKKLRKYGVEGRRAGLPTNATSTKSDSSGTGSGKDSKKVKVKAVPRISTKSGWEKQKADRRKGAVEGSTRRKEKYHSVDNDGEDNGSGGGGGGSGEEFTGFD